MPSTATSSTKAPLFTPRLRSQSRPPEVVDLESTLLNAHEGGEQLETAFMEIKAELAAGRGGATRLLAEPPTLMSPVGSTTTAAVIAPSQVTASSGGRMRATSVDTSSQLAAAAAVAASAASGGGGGVDTEGARGLMRGSFDKTAMSSRSSINLFGAGGTHHASRTEAIKVSSEPNASSYSSSGSISPFPYRAH